MFACFSSLGNFEERIESLMLTPTIFSFSLSSLFSFVCLYFFSFFCFLFLSLCVFFCLKQKIYILILIRLCRWVSDEKDITRPISGNKTFFSLIDQNRSIRPIWQRTIPGKKPLKKMAPQSLNTGDNILSSHFFRHVLRIIAIPMKP